MEDHEQRQDREPEHTEARHVDDVETVFAQPLLVLGPILIEQERRLENLVHGS